MTDLTELGRWRGVASVAWLSVLLLWETAAPCFALFLGARDRWRHGVRNVTIGALNALLVVVGFVWAWKAVAGWATEHRFGLLNWLGLTGWPAALLGVLLFDCWTYWWHRSAHELPGLWNFHRVHHSDARMDVTTANRFHLVEIGLSSLLRLAVIPLIGLQFGHVVLYETLLQGCVQLQHANVALPSAWERTLRWLIVTPGLHKVHHSREPADTDSNYASLLSVWDRLFGSFRLRARPEEIRFGLDGMDADGRQTVRGMIRTPFEK